MEIEFEWDPEKEKMNIRKHGVSFHEAATVFGDPLSWTFSDPDHSVGECRYLTFETSSQGKMLIVSHTDRGKKIRLISSRKVTRRERRYYEEGKPEYDFTQLKGGVRGRYAKRFHAGTNLVKLEPDVARIFADDAAVNEALRSLIKIARSQAKVSH